MKIKPPYPTAEAIARFLHGGQLDKAGVPYLVHCSRVVSNLHRRFPDCSKGEVEAAWLHDVLEDTWADEAFLSACGIHIKVIRVVRELTRSADTYLHWIGRMATHGSLAAVRIKLCDIKDNMNLNRLRNAGAKALDEASLRNVTRYQPAVDLLGARLLRETSMVITTGESQNARKPESQSAEII